MNDVEARLARSEFDDELLALLLLAGFKMSLGSGVSDLQTAVAETRK